MPAKALKPADVKLTTVRTRKGDIVRSKSRWSGGRDTTSSEPLAKSSNVVESRSVEVEIPREHADQGGWYYGVDTSRKQRITLELRYVVRTRKGKSVRFGPYWYAQMADGDFTIWAYVGKTYNVRKAIRRLGEKHAAVRGRVVQSPPRRAGAGTSGSTVARQPTRAAATPAKARRSGHRSTSTARTTRRR